MVLAVLAPLVGLLVLSTVSVYLQPKFIVDWIAKTYPEVVFSVNTSEMIIALTIDDAPTRLDTPIILDILRENNVKATFFCIGYNIITEDSDREILARMIREGHELGNHMSFDAPSYQLNDTEFTKQLLEVDELLQEVKNTTVPPDNSNNDTKWFRPGHGFFTRKMVQKVQTYGYKTALGDVYPHDPAIAISSINAYCIFFYFN
jgi:peptidoglycan/xylan/chitin deacetylase (PgdA/CDA1 family)